MTDNSHNDPSTFSSTPPTMTDTTSLHELAATSPSSSAIKALPRPISIRHSQSYEPAPPSPTSDITLSELRGVRSSASLNLLASFSSTFTPQQHQPQQRPNHRSQIFSNPFKKLQNTFNSKRNSDLTSLNNNNYNNLLNGNRLERPVSSASSANSLTSWRTKGAEMLSKSWGRNRKYSEPLLKNVGAVVSASPIFGVDLKEAIRLSHIPNTPLVPAVLHRCAEFLEAKGVDEVGLYRVPGSHINVQKLKRVFDTGKDYNLLTMDGIDPNDIATLLKLYLRELPSPLMPPILLEQFQSLLTTDRHICQTLRSILVQLPYQNYIVLSYLCHHLSKIAAHSDKTKMTVSNLALVFAPTLAIGSVLFKALLGGFYDTSVDTPESREMGLKIVWGGRQLKDAAGNDIQEWPEDDQDLEGRGYGPSDKEELEGSDVDSTQQCPFYQELPTPTIRHQHSMPALSTPYSENFPGADSSDSYFPTVAPFEKNNIGPLDLDPEDDRPVYGQVLEDPPSSLLLSSPAPSSVDNLKDSGQRRRVEDEEAALMHAMIEREDLVTNSPPPSSPISEGFKHEKQPTLGLGSVRVNVQGGTVVPAVIALVQPLLPSHLTSTATIANNSNTTSATADLTNSGDNHCNGNNNNEIISNGNNTSNSGANTNSNNNYNNKNSILDFQKQEVLATPTVVPVALHITIDAGVVPATAITNINNNISSTANSTKESSLPSPPTSDQKTRA